MDETPITGAPNYRTEGFENQRLCVVPRPQVEAALERAGTRRMTVTDAGYFPAASGHRRIRPNGAPETIVILCVAGAGAVRIAGTAYALTPWTWITIPASPAARVSGVGRRSMDDLVAACARHATSPSSPGRCSASRARSPAARDRRRRRAVRRARQPARATPLPRASARGLRSRVAAADAGVADSILPAEGLARSSERSATSRRASTAASRCAELASMVGMSPSHLSALFRRATGGGPGAFHTSLKMASARSLLDTTTASDRRGRDGRRLRRSAVLLPPLPPGARRQSDAVPGAAQGLTCAAP